MNGHEVLAEIKGDHALKGIPVIVFSISFAEEDLPEYSRIGLRWKEFEDTNCEIVYDQAVANLKSAIDESRADEFSVPILMARDLNPSHQRSR